MPLDMKRERDKQSKMKSGGGGRTWKPQDGPNVIRVLTFKHKVTKEDVANKLYEKSDLGETYEEWNFPITSQFGLNPDNRKAPVLSTPETIALWKKLKDSKDEDDQKKAKNIQPRNQYAMNIVDMNDPDKGVQLYLAAKSVRKYVGELVVDEDFGPSVLGPKGRDFKITYNSKASDPKEFYKIALMDQAKSRSINSSVMEAVQDLYDPKVNSSFVSSKDIKDLDVDAAPVGKENLEGDEPEEASAAKKTNGKKSALFDDED